MDPVLVDTCVWIPFLNRRHGRAKHPLSILLEHDRVGIVGPVLQEILVGIRRKEQAGWVASQLDGCRWLNIEKMDWVLAADLGREVLKNGDALPAADLQIAAIAIRMDYSVWSTDPHFDKIDGLQRFEP